MKLFKKISQNTLIALLLSALLSVLLILTPMFSLLNMYSPKDNWRWRVSGYDRLSYGLDFSRYADNAADTMPRDYWLWVYDLATIVTAVLVLTAVTCIVLTIIFSFSSRRSKKDVFRKKVSTLLKAEYTCTLIYMITGLFYLHVGKRGFSPDTALVFSTVAWVPLLIASAVILAGRFLVLKIDYI